MLFPRQPRHEPNLTRLNSEVKITLQFVGVRLRYIHWMTQDRFNLSTANRVICSLHPSCKLAIKSLISFTHLSALSTKISWPSPSTQTSFDPLISRLTSMESLQLKNFQEEDTLWERRYCVPAPISTSGHGHLSTIL